MLELRKIIRNFRLDLVTIDKGVRLGKLGQNKGGEMLSENHVLESPLSNFMYQFHWYIGKAPYIEIECPIGVSGARQN